MRLLARPFSWWWRTISLDSCQFMASSRVRSLLIIFKHWYCLYNNVTVFFFFGINKRKDLIYTRQHISPEMCICQLLCQCVHAYGDFPFLFNWNIRMFLFCDFIRLNSNSWCKFSHLVSLSYWQTTLLL